MSKDFDWPVGYNDAKERLGERFSRLHLDTKILASHAKPLPNADPVVVPIYHSSTYRFKTIAQFDEPNHGSNFVYRRCGNPTTENVEVVINEIEGGAGSLLYNSGLAAINAVFWEFLGAGTHLICMSPIYSGTSSFINETLKRFGVKVTFLDVEKEKNFAEAVEKSIRPNTKMIYFETIANPTMAVPDVLGTLKVAEKHKILTCIDATFSSPYLIQPLSLGADISLHSCSKYIGGHTDVIAGVVTVANYDNWKRLKLQQLTTGSSLSPYDAALLTRGLKTLALRMKQISENALEIAKFLESHLKVTRVYYPGLESHIQHKYAKEVMNKFSGMIAFDVGSAENAIKLVESLKLIVHAVSLGGTESLIEHPLSMSHGKQLLRDENGPSVAPGLLRFSVGIENVEDIIGDLKQALAQLEWSSGVNISSSRAIGIDLGTTNSCVGVYQNGKIEIIANFEGNRITPSYVAFNETERLIGDAAKDQASRNPENTVSNAKRLIGRRFDDETVQDDIKNWPFVVKSNDGTPVIQVQVKGENREFNAEEISAMVLRRMRNVAEAYLGHEVKDAVITVPAYFNDSQRQATKDAATIAGLNAIRILNEPIAAALAYGLDRGITGEKIVVIFDLGGGTCDVSILSIAEKSVFEVLSTAGDTKLGGEDFDSRLVEHFITEFKKKAGKDISENPRAIRRLRDACEHAKRTLSSKTDATVEVESLVDGIDFKSKITRAKFEELCADLFRKTLEPVERALKDSEIDKTEIDEIVLVGGSSKVPKIQKLLRDFFNGKELNCSINPDEAVAFGAAVQAAVLSGVRDDTIKDVVLYDVTPLSLGTDIVGGRMSNVINRNTRIPANATEPYTTVDDNQTVVNISVYEGERAMAKDNHLLGGFKLCGIPPAPRGTPIIDVTFDINANGILNVTAKERDSGSSNSITIQYEKGRLSQADIDRKVQEAEQFEKEDAQRRDKANAIDAFTDYVYQVKRALEKYGDRLSSAERKRAEELVDQTLRWTKSDDIDKYQLENVETMFKELCEEMKITVES